MSELEMQKKEVVQLLEVADDEKIIEQILQLLKKDKKSFTTDELFERIASRYDDTLKRLAE